MTPHPPLPSHPLLHVNLCREIPLVFSSTNPVLGEQDVIPHYVKMTDKDRTTSGAWHEWVYRGHLGGFHHFLARRSGTQS